MAEQMIAEAKAYAEGKIIQTNAKKNNMTQQASTRFQYAKLRYNGLIMEAEAEGA